MMNGYKLQWLKFYAVQFFLNVISISAVCHHHCVTGGGCFLAICMKKDDVPTIKTTQIKFCYAFTLNTAFGRM